MDEINLNNNPLEKLHLKLRDLSSHINHIRLSDTKINKLSDSEVFSINAFYASDSDHIVFEINDNHEGLRDSDFSKISNGKNGFFDDGFMKILNLKNSKISENSNIIYPKNIQQLELEKNNYTELQNFTENDSLWSINLNKNI